MHKLSTTRVPENEPIATEILALRQEMVDLLGYKSFADFTTEPRMAKSGDRIKDFIQTQANNFKPAVLKESAELLNFIRKYENDPAYELDATDVVSGVPQFYMSKMRSQASGIDAAKVQEYLPLDNVLAVLFDTLKTLYGVTVVPAPDEPTYSPDVTAYKLFNEDQKHISTVWCDWFARSGKRNGAWCEILYIADRSNGNLDKPHLGIVCANLQPPTKDRPSLLDIRSAETVWHEFGHFIHASFSSTELRDQSAWQSAWDFVEAPSQIMENWIWQKEILQKIARHYKTNKPLPAKTIDKIISTRSQGSAASLIFTLSLSALDYRLHSGAGLDQSLTETARTVRSDFFAAPMADYDKSICYFTHIFSGGYAAAYYGYVWAQAIEADLFSRFEKEGVLNPKTGRDYRDKVLARGDQVDPDVLVRDFLGRDFNTQALLHRSGLA